MACSQVFSQFLAGIPVIYPLEIFLYYVWKSRAISRKTSWYCTWRISWPLTCYEISGLKWSQKLEYNRMFLNPAHGIKYIKCQAVNAGSVMSIRTILLRSHLLTNIKYFKWVWRIFSVEILPSFLERQGRKFFGSKWRP